MWALKQELQTLLPGADLTLRHHRLALKTEPNGLRLMPFGVLVTRKVEVEDEQGRAVHAAARIPGARNDAVLTIAIPSRFDSARAPRPRTN